MEQVRPFFSAATVVFQQLAIALLALCAIAAMTSTLLAFFGIVAWVDIPLSFQDEPLEHAGMMVQLALTLFLVSMCFLIPTNQRVMKLEHAHHAFSIRMEDVTRAYTVAHAADRAGLFHCHSEFDAIRERITYLHAHPDLGSLEPDILELAAQMSRVSQDLAHAYSDERVDRAYDFLKQRQAEIDAFNDRLEHAKAIQADIRRLSNQVDLDEAVARSQLRALLEDLGEALPEIMVEHDTVDHKIGVVPIHQIAKS